MNIPKPDVNSAVQGVTNTANNISNNVDSTVTNLGNSNANDAQQVVKDTSDFANTIITMIKDFIT
ncbi:11695_t:CDS:1, partial [Scutellospora calospora]